MSWRIGAMRRRAAILVGFLTFCGALAGFLYLGTAAEAGQAPVLAAGRDIVAGQTIQATTQYLSPAGTLVHVSAAAARDTIPQSQFRSVADAVALVNIPQGSVILRSELAMGSGLALRQMSIELSFVPPGLEPGSRVDLFAVSGSQGASVAPGADLCGTVSEPGCVVPLAQGVKVIGVDSPGHAIVISVPPSQVAPWLLMDATQAIWAVPAGALTCGGTEQSVSDPYSALQAIRRGSETEACSGQSAAGGAGS